MSTKDSIAHCLNGLLSIARDFYDQTLLMHDDQHSDCGEFACPTDIYNRQNYIRFLKLVDRLGLEVQKLKEPDAKPDKTKH